MPNCKFFIEIAPRHECSPVNLLHIFRTLSPNNTSGRLLLQFRGFSSRKKKRMKPSIITKYSPFLEGSLAEQQCVTKLQIQADIISLTANL